MEKVDSTQEEMNMIFLSTQLQSTCGFPASILPFLFSGQPNRLLEFLDANWVSDRKLYVLLNDLIFHRGC